MVATLKPKNRISKGKLIKELRIKRGWTQAQLSEISGLSERTIQRFEKGTKAALETLRALAAAFDITVDELFSTEDPKQEEKSRRKVFHLPRLHSGKDLINVINGSELYQNNHDSLNNPIEVEFIGSFMQDIHDYGDSWDYIEPKDKVEVSYSFNQRIKELEDMGFWVFGLQRKILCKFNFASEQKEIPMVVCTIMLVRSNSPEIIKTKLGKEVYPVTFN